MANTRGNRKSRFNDVLKLTATLEVADLATAKQALKDLIPYMNEDRSVAPEVRFNNFLQDKLDERIRKILLDILELGAEIKIELVEKIGNAKKEKEKQKGVHEENITDEDKLKKIKEEKGLDELFGTLKVFGAQEMTEEWLASMPDDRALYTPDVLARISLLAQWLEDNSRGLDKVGEMIGEFSQFDNRLKEKKDTVFNVREQIETIRMEAEKAQEPSEKEIKELMTERAALTTKEEKEGSLTKAEQSTKEHLKTKIDNLRQQQKTINLESRKKVEKLTEKYDQARSELEKQVEQMPKKVEATRKSIFSTISKGLTRKTSQTKLSEGKNVIPEQKEEKLKRTSFFDRISGKPKKEETDLNAEGPKKKH